MGPHWGLHRARKRRPEPSPTPTHQHNQPNCPPLFGANFFQRQNFWSQFSLAPNAFGVNLFQLQNFGIKKISSLSSDLSLSLSKKKKKKAI